MKKVLLAGTALLGVALATPAAAEINLDLGGHFRGYAVYSDNDETGGAGDSLREFDFRRDSEVYISGETTLDNGLTVGFHTEQDIDAASTTTDEVYAYFSGGWGRVNFGSEDGAAYLLQVAAPSADSNVDGLRTYIQALSNEAGVPAGAAGLLGAGTQVLDYDHADFRTSERITYMTPKFNGFQAGVSYSPKAGENGFGNNVAAPDQDDNAGEFEDMWEVAARWDGELSGFGLSLGAGYSTSDLEAPVGVALNNARDGVDTWNVGASVAFSGFTVGAAYKNSQQETVSNAVGPVFDDVDVDTWVLGGAWDNGPYHLGASYLNEETERDSAANAINVEADRFTVGAGYTFGPGMTFRGAVAMGEFDTGASATSNDFTQVTVGTDIQF